MTQSLEWLSNAQQMPYPLPDNEEERLEVLRQYDILDTPPEESFDELTRVASHICDTPIALISLTDANRQWFKSKVGTNTTEFPRDLSFCAHVITQPNRILNVPDLTSDARFAHHPLVTDNPKFRFYAGTPLTTKENHALGALCVLDYVPRNLSSQQLESLQILGCQVLAQIELRRQLASERARLQMVVKNAPILLYALDSHGTVTGCDGKKLVDFGVQSQQLIGRSIFELYSDQPDIEEKLHQVLAGTPQVWISHYHNHVYENRVTPLEESNGKALGALGIAFDITIAHQAEVALKELNENLEHQVIQRTTELKQANKRLQAEITERIQIYADLEKINQQLIESESKFKSVVDNIPGAIYRRLRDVNWTIDFISNAIEGISGYPANNFLHNRLRTYASIIHPEDRERVEQCITEAIELKQPYILEYRILHASGDIRWVYEKGQLLCINSEHQVWLDGAIFDISERKIAEAEILKTLEKEKELANLKERFMSMTSHEFRTPLTVILSSSELLRYYYQKLSPEKRQSVFEQIEISTQQLLELLDDILAINKADAGKTNFNPVRVELKEFCCELVNEMQLSAGEGYFIAFTTAGDCTSAVIDEKLLRHILTNLLSNAIKYSPEAGKIELQLTCVEGKAIFQVKDRGIGIPEKDLPMLFESFHRASNVGKIKGTGLGMSIVKRMVDLHGGTIEVESEVGVGTIFTVTLLC